METQKLYLPFGCLVRRRALPGEPGNRAVGKVLGGNLAGTAHFVMYWTRDQPQDGAASDG